MSVPRYVVNMDEDPRRRWAAVTKDFGQRIRDAEAVVVHTLRRMVPAANVLLGIVGGTMSALRRTVLFHEELRGIADDCGVEIGRLITLQLVYEVAAACTSVIAHEEGGGLIHGRTMDWEMPFLRRLTIEVDFVVGGKVVARCATWAGYVGILTGLAIRNDSQENFSVSINYRTGTGTVWGNLKQALKSAWPIGFLVRSALIQEATYATAKEIFSSALLVAPCYIMLCGAAAGEGCIITRDRGKGAHDPIELVDRGLLVQVNMDDWSNDPEDSVLWSLERRSLASSILKGIKKTAAQDVWELLRRRPITNSLTIYATVMMPYKSHIETRVCVDESYDPTVEASCVKCARGFFEDLNPPGRCSHIGPWHEQRSECSWRCGLSLVRSGHWACCDSRDRDSACCVASPPHEI